MALTRGLRHAWRTIQGRQLRSLSSLPAEIPQQRPETWQNPAAVLHGVNDLRFQDQPLGQLQPGYVRVAVKALGICGSDIHYVQHGRIGKFVLTEPMVIGHECAGEVVEVGSGVDHIREGTRVALEPQIPCWGNKMARQGRYNLDPDVKFFATPPVHGSLARYVDHPAEWCFAMPDSVSYEEGAMVEPLSNAVHACRRGAVGPGKRVAILGAGPVGLGILAAARAFGASNVAIADIQPNNLPVAERLGARHVLDLSHSKAREAEAVRNCFPPDGPDVIIDAAGFESTLNTALNAVAPGGKIVLVGLGQERCCVPMMETVFKELDFLGSFRYVNTYPLCLELLEDKRIDCGPFITHRFGFSAEEVAKGFQTAMAAKTTGAIKVMFHM